MQNIDFWKLSDEFSVMNAALLFAGFPPGDVEDASDTLLEKNYPGYVATRTALCGAILAERIEPVYSAYYEQGHSNERVVDVRRTLLSVYDLDRFFRARGYICEHFIRPTSSHLDGHAASHPQFSAKLAAANKAWSAVTSNPSLLAGKSPKQALKKWLTENAGDLGLTGKDGKPNATGIEEICKVANWKPEGGATPTPSPNGPPPSSGLILVPSTRVSQAPRREAFVADLDDEIPF
ncbi:hypothetical protein [Caulobacter henricii]|uniref:hypothetical protein n=1 Tax=Caulobacter henricii TaxID=69395 RepID=UPI000B1C9DD3|nr:hypothetical protein [Caulobacter henricii]